MHICTLQILNLGGTLADFWGECMTSSSKTLQEIQPPLLPYIMLAAAIHTRHYQWYITLSYKPLIYRYGIFHTLRIRHTMCYEIIIILRIKLL